MKSTFRLDLLNADAARIAVQRPAKECGVEFTEGATTKLVDDLREVAVQSPTGATEIQLGPLLSRYSCRWCVTGFGKSCRRV